MEEDKDEKEPAPGNLFRRIIERKTVIHPVTPDEFKMILLRDKPGALFHANGGENPVFLLREFTDTSVEVTYSNTELWERVGFDYLYTKLAQQDITLFSYGKE